MGIYLNPGKQGFQIAVNSEIFVDKTAMILYLNTIVNTQQRFASVSRPRRFGKTMAADMLCAYYGRTSDSREMFSTKAVTTLQSRQPSAFNNKRRPWDEYLGQFDVIRLVMTDFFTKTFSVDETLDRMQRSVIREIKKEYPNVDYFDDRNLKQSLEDVYAETARKIVIVIDEWDAVFRERPEDKDGQTAYLDFLRNLLKDRTYIALAYMTGILPIKKYGKHSALNMFTEYSMTSPKSLARYVGFTAEEVRGICAERGLDYQAMRDWYDGYRISNRPSTELSLDDAKLVDATPADTTPVDLSPNDCGVFEIYSPLSVVNAALFRKLENYWNNSETYEALADYIRKDFDGLKDAVALLMDGGRLKIDTSSYQNDMTTFHSRDDVLSLLIHLGYLGFDDESSEVFIPNREILDVFKTSTKGKEWEPTFRSFELSHIRPCWARSKGNPWRISC